MELGSFMILRFESGVDLGDPYTGYGTLVFGEDRPSRNRVLRLEHAESLSNRDMTRLRNEPGVQLIAPDIPTSLVEPAAVSSATSSPLGDSAWGVSATMADRSPYTGQGIVVAILDTGIDTSHAGFHGVEIIERDFTGEGNGDRHGHGTHVAGTVFGRSINGYRFGIAPGIQKALIGKVLDSKGQGSTEYICEAMLWAAYNGANVINISLGIDFPGLVTRWVEAGMPAQKATSQALANYRANLLAFDTVVQHIQMSYRMLQSILIVAAAGNESQRPEFSVTVSPPAAAVGIMAVGALRSEGEPHDRLSVAPFSNAGPNISAPGVDICSSAPNNTFRVMSGTSMASPHVTGVAALWAEKLIREERSLNPEQLKAKLINSASKAKIVLESSDSMDVGFGLVQAPCQ